MDDVVNANILVDLDSILDTRMSVLYTLSPDIASSVMKNDLYRKRVRDTFGVLSFKVFDTFYKKRNKAVLLIATPTPMLELLKEYCIEAHNVLMSRGIADVPTLYVNMYPYDLNEEECVNLLKLFYATLPVNMNVEIFSMDNSELTTTYVSNLVTTVIKYDLLTWLEYQNGVGNLTKSPLLDVSCVAPMIANGNKKSSDIIQKDFDDLRGRFGTFTRLIMLQSRMFSMA